MNYQTGQLAPGPADEASEGGARTSEVKVWNYQPGHTPPNTSNDYVLLSDYEALEARLRSALEGQADEDDGQQSRWEEGCEDCYTSALDPGFHCPVHEPTKADLQEHMKAVEAEFDLAVLRDHIESLQDEIFHGPADSTDRDNPQGILTRLSRLEESSADPTDDHVAQDQNPSPIDRIKELSIDPDGPLGDKFSYRWDHGHETLDEGNVHYSGTYHPGGLCVGNPCEFCGSATYEPTDPANETRRDQRRSADIHTCHADCPCHKGEQPLPDFIEKAEPREETG